MRSLSTIFLFLLILTGCGQTGKLYLPESMLPAEVQPGANDEIAASTIAPDKDQFEQQLKSSPANSSP